MKTAKVPPHLRSSRQSILTYPIAPGYIKSEEIYPNEMKPDQKIKDIRAWLKSRGVLDLEPVTLFAEQLEKVSDEVINYFISLMRYTKVYR